MKKGDWFIVRILFIVGMLNSMIYADVFSSGDTQFEIEFVTINDPSRESLSFRIGKYEVTNFQWNQFALSLGKSITGNPSTAYDEESFFKQPEQPVTMVSWLEAAQFINWLNVDSGYHPAYRFDGVQGTENYSFAMWNEAEMGTSPFRHKDSFYFLPKEDEWIRAGYWNGTEYQDYATRNGESLHQGNGVSGSGWNYWIFDDIEPSGQYATEPAGPWNVGSGSEELNGTYDMMGNIKEWTETPMPGDYGGYTPSSEGERIFKGGSYSDDSPWLWYGAYGSAKAQSDSMIGFRVASEVPEPSCVVLMLLSSSIVRIYRKP